GGAEGMGVRGGGAPRAPGGRELLKQSFEQARTEIGGMFDDRRDVLDPGPGADLNRPPAEVEDPAQRAAIVRSERAARHAARQPFQAPAPPEIVFTRRPTTGRTQPAAVAAALHQTGLSAHPERVYGVYRVPDRFDHQRSAEAKAYVEWEIAHEPGGLNGAAADILTTAFPREAHIAFRR